MSRLRPPALRLPRPPRELRLLLAIAAVLAVAWAFATAPLQGPDESGHYAYAQFLAETGQGPSPDPIGQSVSTELASALELLNLRSTLGVLGARPANTALEEERWRELERSLPDAAYEDGIGPSPLAKNPQLYYVYEAVPYLLLKKASLFDRLLAMRLANGLLFLLTVWLSWLLAVEVFGRRRRLEVTVATAVVALWPMLGFMAGVINPDTALVTAYTAVALAAIRVVMRGLSPARVAAVFGLAAVCLLVHGRGLPALAVAAVACLVAAVRDRQPLRRAAALAGAAVAAVGVPVLLARVILPPGTSTGGLYGGEVNTGRTFSVKQFVGQTWQFYFDRLPFMSPRLGPDYGYQQVVIERWLAGVFGALEVTYPRWVYDLAEFSVVAFLLAVYTTAVVRRGTLRRAWPVLAVLGTFAVALMLLLHAASYRALVTGPDPILTGRYLLPLVPLVGLLVAWVIGALPRRARGLVAGAVLATMLVLNVAGIGLTVVRFGV